MAASRKGKWVQPSTSTSAPASRSSRTGASTAARRAGLPARRARPGRPTRAGPQQDAHLGRFTLHQGGELAAGQRAGGGEHADHAAGGQVGGGLDGCSTPITIGRGGGVARAAFQPAASTRATHGQAAAGCAPGRFTPHQGGELAAGQRAGGGEHADHAAGGQVGGGLDGWLHADHDQAGVARAQVGDGAAVAVLQVTTMALASRSTK